MRCRAEWIADFLRIMLDSYDPLEGLCARVAVRDVVVLP